MKVNRETRRTSAQFLNSLAVAILIAGVVGPTYSGAAKPMIVATATIVSLALHVLALCLVGRSKER
jgi:hypothetical protein